MIARKNPLNITSPITVFPTPFPLSVMRRSAGGSMIRAMSRVVGAGTASVKDSVSAKFRGRRRQAITLSAPASPTHAGYVTATAPATDYDEWEAVGDEEGFEEMFGVEERFVFGNAPSQAEAEEAIGTLQQMFVPITFSQVMDDGYPSLDSDSMGRGMITPDTPQKEMIIPDTVPRSFSTGSETDWTEPAVHMYSRQTLHSQERENIVDAFRVLQVNPSVKRMVVSLSSDKAVWEAVMNNEVVQELKKALYEAENNEPQNSEKNSEEQRDVATRILKWVVDNTRTKILDFYGMITNLVNELFHKEHKDGNTDSFDFALKSSFMLSIAVFIIVVVTRIQKS